MEWTKKDNLICVKLYHKNIYEKNLKYIVKDKSMVLNYNEALVELAKKRLKFSNQSIYAKFQNIRHIYDQLGLKHESTFSPLSNYSKDSLAAVLEYAYKNNDGEFEV